MKAPIKFLQSSLITARALLCRVDNKVSNLICKITLVDLNFYSNNPKYMDYRAVRNDV